MSRNHIEHIYDLEYHFIIFLFGCNRNKICHKNSHTFSRRYLCLNVFFVTEKFWFYKETFLENTDDSQSTCFLEEIFHFYRKVKQAIINYGLFLQMRCDVFTVMNIHIVAQINRCIRLGGVPFLGIN
jgi:hypothetical protein